MVKGHKLLQTTTDLKAANGLPIPLLSETMARAAWNCWTNRLQGVVPEDEDKVIRDLTWLQEQEPCRTVGQDSNDQRNPTAARCSERRHLPSISGTGTSRHTGAQSDGLPDENGLQQLEGDARYRRNKLHDRVSGSRS